MMEKSRSKDLLAASGSDGSSWSSSFSVKMFPNDFGTSWVALPQVPFIIALVILSVGILVALIFVTEVMKIQTYPEDINQKSVAMKIIKVWAALQRTILSYFFAYSAVTLF
jgi:hypothetical protein